MKVSITLHCETKDMESEPRVMETELQKPPAVVTSFMDAKMPGSSDELHALYDWLEKNPGGAVVVSVTHVEEGGTNGS